MSDTIDIRVETVGPDCTSVFTLDSDGRVVTDHGTIWRDAYHHHWVWSRGDDELGIYPNRGHALGAAIEVIEEESDTE